MTRPVAGLLLALSILAIAAAQLLAKARVGAISTQGIDGLPGILMAAASDPLIWLMIALLVTSAGLWYAAMWVLPVSIMVPCAAAVSPLVAIGAHFQLGEPLGAAKIGAIALITVGVVWLALE